LRQAVAEHEPEAAGSGGSLTLQLGYRPPYDWDGVLAFLRGRMIRDVEHVTEQHYARTVRLGKRQGWIKVTHASPAKRSLLVEFSHSLTPVLPALLGRVRNLFDLSARPDLINGHLMKDPLLAEAVAAHPGLRVPGAFDSFEMAIRAILGQQITVKAATTIACRFADAFGEKIETPFAELSRLSPLPGIVAGAGVDAIAGLGIVSARAKCLMALAQAFKSGVLTLESGGNPERAICNLVALPGIGHWTAHYIAMRALRWPDAFPKEDIVVRNNLGGVSAKEAERISQPWRPWRSYAVLHIWRGLGT
jgi:AraC family transcriptional regulator of adaptative response / DNA-3-methyladenine glycosylase II